MTRRERLLVNCPAESLILDDRGVRREGKPEADGEVTICIVSCLYCSDP